MKRAVTYYRVSTERQGKSGLGLDAQQELVKHFAAMNGYILLKDFVEVESGKKVTNRPILKQALQTCKDQNATLLIAKLDRLSRNVAFISKLMEANIDFVAADNPNASKLVVHIMAAFAEHERDQISERTTNALRAAKLRGIELGTNGKFILSKVNRIKAAKFADKMEPFIALIKYRGITTVRGIADELNRLNIAPYRGSEGKWHVATVHRLMKQIEKSKQAKEGN